MHGIVFDIQTNAIHDGPGIRTLVFLKGCPLRCGWCHNPESWRAAPEPAAGDARATIGAAMTVADVMERVRADRPFYETSGGGVTFTGGEPTAQAEFLLALAAAARQEGIHSALETCGHFPTELVAPLVAGVDLFLFDLKLIDAAEHERWTGVNPAPLHANFRAVLAAAGPGRVVPRVPVIPGVNTAPDRIGELTGFLREAGYTGAVHLMPYNDLARGKWERIGRGDRYCDFGRLAPDDLAAIAARWRDAGFFPKISE